VGKALELDVSRAIIKVPHHHWRNGTLSVRGSNLSAGNQLAIARNIERRNLCVVSSKELLLVWIIHILNYNGSSRSIYQGLGLNWVVVDHAQVLATKAAEVL
jgi:hypothetical protein